MAYKIKIDRRALKDIQDIIEYYESKSIGLGVKFENELDIFIDTLSRNPLFQIRYEKVRCLPLRKFPFMIHYTVDESKCTVFIHAVFHTSRSPKLWNK